MRRSRSRIAEDHGSRTGRVCSLVLILHKKIVNLCSFASITSNTFPWKTQPCRVLDNATGPEISSGTWKMAAGNRKSENMKMSLCDINASYIVFWYYISTLCKALQKHFRSDHKTLTFLNDAELGLHFPKLLNHPKIHWPLWKSYLSETPPHCINYDWTIQFFIIKQAYRTLILPLSVRHSLTDHMKLRSINGPTSQGTEMSAANKVWANRWGYNN